MLYAPLNELKQVQWVQQPEQWNEDRIQEKHHCFLLNDSIQMGVIVVKSDSFDC